jgi:hypothetical protein
MIESTAMSEVKSQARVIELRDERSGLDAFVVIDHELFPVAAGGTRMLPDVEPLEVARLARAMTWKLAACGIPLAGAKAGIRFSGEDRDAVLTAYRRALEPYADAFVTGPDISFQAHGRIRSRPVSLVASAVPRSLRRRTSPTATAQPRFLASAASSRFPTSSRTRAESTSTPPLTRTNTRGPPSMRSRGSFGLRSAESSRPPTSSPSPPSPPHSERRAPISPRRPRRRPRCWTSWFRRLKTQRKRVGPGLPVRQA